MHHRASGLSLGNGEVVHLFRQLRDQRVSFEAGLARPGARRAWKTRDPRGFGTLHQP